MHHDHCNCHVDDSAYTFDSVLPLTWACLLQDGNHAFIRLNFNFGPGYEPCAKFPGAICLKELSFRSSDPRHAQRVRLVSVFDHSCPPVARPLQGYSTISRAFSPWRT